MKIEADEIKVISTKQYKRIIKLEWLILTGIAMWILNIFFIILH